MSVSLPADVFIQQRNLQIARYLEVGVVTALVADWLEFFLDEVELIWSRTWNWSAALYLLSRYSAFIDVPLRLADYVGYLSPEACLTTQKIATWTHAFGTAISDLILIARTYAIYKQSKVLLTVVFVTWMGLVAIGVGTVVIFLESNLFVPQDLPVPGCHLVAGSPIILGGFVALLGFELIIVTLTSVKARRYYLSRNHGARYHLTSVLYRDGLLFFIPICVCSIATTITLVAAPPDFLGLSVTLTRVVHSSLCCHVLLDLRRAAAQRARTYSHPDGILISPVDASRRSGAFTRRQSRSQDPTLDEALELRDIATTTA